MFKSFIIITLRSLSNHRLFTFINVLGLAVGMACALLISIYLIHETSYDNFHTDGDRIYRVSIDGALRGQDLKIAVTSPIMAKTITKEYDEVESSLRIVRMGAWLVKSDEKRFNEDKLYFTDSNFFNFFTYPLLYGNSDSVFNKPQNLVLTRSAAIKYFGNVNVLGEELSVENFKKPFIISGIVEDIPSNSHFHFDILGPIAAIEKYLRPVWINNNVYTYLKVNPNTDGKLLEEKIDALVWKYVVPEVKEYFGSSDESFADGTNVLKYKLQELRKIHLTSNLDVELEENSRAMYIYSFGIIALLILIVACINFINLSTANSTNRAREVVLRKAIGSERKMLIFQFLTESVIFSFGALLLALLMAEIIMPQFNHYLGMELKFGYINNLYSIGIIIFFTLFLGILAGSYPAFLISSYEPVKVLHGMLNIGVRSQKVRSVFVVSQFFISILIIILTLVVYAQVEFMKDMDLGFSKEKILVIRRPDALKEQIIDFKKEIVEHPNIEAATNTNSIPGRNFMAASFMVEDDSSRHNVFMNQIHVSQEFFETFKITLVDGRFFTEDGDAKKPVCLMNETAAREILKDSVVGSYLEATAIKHKKGDQIEIIGIVKDFNFKSADKEIDPLVISLMRGNWEGFLNVRLSGRAQEKSIDFLEETWSKYTSEYPFIYFFLDNDYNKNYTSFLRTGKIFMIFAFLSVFVACLGLFGLILFTSNQRAKEISIRKSLGASYFRILFLLLKETVILVFYASVIAWISAYIIANVWLKDFHVPIPLSPKFFVLASVIVLALSIVVVLYQSYFTSKVDPSTAMKAE